MPISGAAARLAAVFRAPLTGVIFAFEMPFQDDLAHEALVPSLVSSVVAYSMVVATLGSEPVFAFSRRTGYGFERSGAADQPTTASPISPDRRFSRSTDRTNRAFRYSFPLLCSPTKPNPSRLTPAIEWSAAFAMGGIRRPPEVRAVDERVFVPPGMFLRSRDG